MRYKVVKNGDHPDDGFVITDNDEVILATAIFDEPDFDKAQKLVELVTMHLNNYPL